MAFGRRVSVGRLPVAKMVLPQDLKGCQNGKLPKSLLRPIAPSGQMHHYAATSWAMLRELAAQEGLDLVHVGDYRLYTQQVALFMSRMKRFPDAKKNVQVTRIFNGEKWFLHVGAPVATPGTSNHGWGLAIDAALKTKAGVVTISTKPKTAKRSGLEFLLAEAPSLGWSWELQSEPWHIRYVAGDKTPARVKACLAGNVGV
jgi:LAS superfamily LD-carboxypeptidase LdcB